LRSRKQYGFDHVEISELAYLELESVTMTERGGKKSRVYAAASLPSAGRLNRALLAAFYRRHEGKVNLPTFWLNLKAFCTFLHAAGVLTVEEIDREMMERYRLHLTASATKGFISGRTPHARFMQAQEIALEALRVRNLMFRQIENPFPGAGRMSKPREHLGSEALRLVLRAAKQEVAEVVSVFGKFDESLIGADLSVALRYTLDNHDGIVPKMRHRDDDRRLSWLYRKAGGMENIARRLHATRDSLLPFLIMITYWTAGNVEAILGMKRDCLTEGLIPGTFEIRWMKERANAEQVVTLTDSGKSSAPRLIRDVLRMTEPFLHLVDDQHRNLLFLCRGSGRKGVFGPLTTTMVGDGLQDFIERHSLPFDRRGLGKFNLAMMRPSALAEAYRRTGNVCAVQRFANHRHLATTVRYVLDRVTDAKHDGVISRRQGKLFDEVRAGKAKALTVRRVAIRAFGSSNDCADLLDAPMPQKGECPAWLWPFNDPGFVVPNSPKYLAEVVRLRDALRDARSVMRADRFKVVYSALIDTVEDALSKFSADSIAQAEALAIELGPLPELGYE
jgi:hypothetical protein